MEKIENKPIVMDHEKIRLDKFREIISFSFLFITFFNWEIHFTKEIFGFVKLKQQKIKIRYKWFDDGLIKFFGGFEIMSGKLKKLINMTLDICYIKTPFKYENIEVIKNLIGSSKVKAYSIDLKDNSIIEGLGWIASDESYNYHNNYDTSKDCMWFTDRPKSFGEIQWFTLNYERVLEIQKENNKIILEVLEPIINKAKENI